MERITSLTKLQPPFSVFSLNYYLTNKDCPLHRRALLYPISNLTSPPRAREWPDGFGRPPAVRDLAWRMAADGHSMLAPNPFFGLTASIKLRSPARLHSTSRIQPTGGTPINPRRVTIRSRLEYDSLHAIFHGLPHYSPAHRCNGAGAGRRGYARRLAALWRLTLFMAL